MTETASNAGIQVRLFQVDAHMLGVREDEVLKVIDWITPTPLPFSPSAVTGIISVEGRMFTVVDLRALLEASPKNCKQIIALRGDEQLALAVDESTSVAKVDDVDEERKTSDLFEGEVRVDGKEVPLLNPETLFAAVIRGRERRRRRL